MGPPLKMSSLPTDIPKATLSNLLFFIFILDSPLKPLMFIAVSKFEKVLLVILILPVTLSPTTASPFQLKF